MKGETKERLKVIIPVIIILFVVLVLILAYSFKKSDNNDNSGVDMKEVATVNNPVTSPSGKYQIKINEETIKGVKHNKFSVFIVSNGNPEATAIFTCKDVFRTRDTLYFVWGDSDGTNNVFQRISSVCIKRS